MIFSSYTFLIFFAVILSGYVALLRYRPAAIPVYLAVVSLVFYGWKRWSYLIIILVSITVNFLIGRRLSGKKASRRLLIAGISFNLLVLAYFKYAAFLVEIINDVGGWALPLPHVRLPLGISFFTFLQIAYLCDVFRARKFSYSFTDYTLFVTFFPHLIAGPLVHHNELIPQFRWKKSDLTRFARNLAIGLSIFVIGLAKKVLVADSLAPCADRIFGAAGEQVLTLAEAWSGALAYTLQIYFDFSGYSDMAIGLAFMLGVRLPLNFYSPYKAASIIDFWRCWHMTLSRWLREYLYIPLGGNRKGPARRYMNLLITMLLGGLWHGANWTFVIWGGLHGLMLCLNHGWRSWRKKPVNPFIGTMLTFLCVCVTWTFFRAESVTDALSVIGAMTGMNGIQPGPLLETGDAVLIAAALGMVWVLPNTFQLMRRYKPALDPSGIDMNRPSPWIIWRASAPWAAATALLFLTVLAMINNNSPFLYFRF
ncbi:MAG: MBOAT family protein [Alphaproteobacteria bacterium]|nr:MBOAT family protein [Alphaproteobacteria bacterium]